MKCHSSLRSRGRHLRVSVARERDGHLALCREAAGTTSVDSGRPVLRLEVLTLERQEQGHAPAAPAFYMPLQKLAWHARHRSQTAMSGLQASPI